MPASWFKDRAACRTFVSGPRYSTLSDLVLHSLGAERLGADTQYAAYSVGRDLFELARVAALPGEESFSTEWMERNGGCDCHWREYLCSISKVAIIDSYRKNFINSIIEMQNEAESSHACRENNNHKGEC